MRLRFYILVLLSAVFATGCVTIEPDIHPVGPVAGDGETEVTLNMFTAETSVSVTRAISADNENFIKELDIVVFKEDGADYRYAYHTHATDISNTDGSINKKFKVYLKNTEGTEKHHIVALANMRSAITGAEGSLTTSMTKAQVMQMLKVNTSAKWNVGADFTPLPMYGEVKGAYQISASTTGATLGAIELRRSLARVDIGLGLTLSGSEYVINGISDDFIISNIKIYNTMSEGYVYPLPGMCDTDGDPVYPSVAGLSANSGPLEYELESPWNGLVRTIYIAEAANRGKSAEDVAFIMIKGYYGAGNTTKPSWYRIDFLDPDVVITDDDPYADDTMDILRNSRYIVNITAVEGDGYNSELEAALSRASNMKAELIHWNEGSMESVSFNDDYMLGISSTEIEVGKRAKDNIALRVTTDYPNAWRAEITDSPHEGEGAAVSWLSFVSASSGTGAGKHDLTLRALQYDGYYSRTAYIHVYAGKLHTCTTVLQTSFEVMVLGLNPSNGEHMFASGRGADPIIPLTLTVTWEPNLFPVSVAQTHTNGGLDLGSQVPLTISGSPATLTFTPASFTNEEVAQNSSLEKSTRLDFTLTNEEGNMITRTIILRQKHVGLSAPVTKAYPMVLNQYGMPLEESVTVYSNLPWTATLDNQDGCISRLTSATGIGNIAGEALKFEMAQGGPSKMSGTSKITITSTTGAFAPVQITVVGYWGYPYTYKDGNTTRNLVAYPTATNNKITRPTANDRCGSLAPEGQWRLPKATELRAMYTYVAYTQQLRLERGFLESAYWASDNGFLGFFGYNFVNMTDGSIDSTANLFATNYYRCVRNQ